MNVAAGTLRGNVWKFGDQVNTDAVIPAKYAVSVKPEELGPHAMEGIRPGFAQLVKAGDIMVGGQNFGCGSSREIAPVAIRAAGISAVVAASFARIFFRNALNLGFPIFESPEAAAQAQEGDELEVEPASGRIRNLTRTQTYQATLLPPFMQHLIDAGGLKAYVRERLAEQTRKPA
jgi:3-isopropylmalate dehydratase small subunit